MNRVTFFVCFGLLGASQERRVVPSENLLDELLVKPERIRRRTVVSHASALLNDTVQQGCTGGWRTDRPKETIGKGSNAEIVKVAGTDHPKQTVRKGSKPEIDNRQSFVVKIALPDASKDEVDDEVKIMQAASTCTNVAKVEASKPCLNGDKINTGAYVMRRLSNSLDKWLGGNNEDHVRKCAPHVAEQVANGLKCLHRTAGYIHGDLKADNILIDGIDRTTRCPNTVIADFGLSSSIGSPVRKYPSEYYDISTHLPASLFSGHGDTLGIKSRKGTDLLFVSQPAIDWCSLTIMMIKDFSYDIGTSFDCGWMGPERKTDVFLPKGKQMGTQRAPMVEERPFCDYWRFETVKVFSSHLGGFMLGFVREIDNTDLTVFYGREVHMQILSANSPLLEKNPASRPNKGDRVRVRSSIGDSNPAVGYVTKMNRSSDVYDLYVLYAAEWLQKNLSRCSDDVVPWE